MSDPQVETPRERAVFTAERAKTFVDAVVAIAMTLLILPLVESVAEDAGHGIGVGRWLERHSGQLLSFGISFAIIAMFWIGHHRVFARVDRVSVGLLWALVGWMATIVWLPVPTAMSGQMDQSPLLYVLYIGSMALTSLAALGIQILLLTSPRLHDIPRPALQRGLIADVLLVVFFGLALLLAETTFLGYSALFILVLVGPLQALFVRLLHIERETQVAA